MQHEILTFGYEGLSVDAFIARLQAAKVETVVDVRANPISRKPGLSKKALIEKLAKAHIKYVHAVELGCPKDVRDRYKSDGDWRAYTRAFLRYLANQEGPVAKVASVAKASRSCLICFEANFNFCHRVYVARAVAPAFGAQVVHLTVTGSVVDQDVKSAA